MKHKMEKPYRPFLIKLLESIEIGSCEVWHLTQALGLSNSPAVLHFDVILLYVSNGMFLDGC